MEPLPHEACLISMASTRALAPLLFALLLSSCLRREGRNSDCRWPTESTPSPASAAHLSADAELAEDLAIRFADTHHGLRTPHFVSTQVYATERDRCMHSLFGQAARSHGVPPSQVTASLGQNRALTDAATVLSFFVLYAAFSFGASRLLWRRYPPEDLGWTPACIMTLFAALALAAGALMLGEVWSLLVETARLGNDHISYRASRLWWANHRTFLFSASAALFILTALLSARRPRAAP